MSDANKDNVKFSLKVVINKLKTKVLFAEINSDFADVLLSFLTLPLGKFVKILEKHYGDESPVIGSLNTLYNGLLNLADNHFWTEGGKQMLLDPISSFGDQCRKLKLDIADTQPTKYFSCDNLFNCQYAYSRREFSIYYGVVRCGDCGELMKKEVRMRNKFNDCGMLIKYDDDDDAGGVFIANSVTFILSDDLQIFPNVAGSVIQIVSNLGITNADWGEMTNVTFGFNEIMDLVKGSFLSRTPLTDIILNKGQINLAMPSELGILLPKVEKKGTSNSDKITLKVIVQKSTNKLLFAQADEDFVEFLFSLLTIPLGGVESLLDSNTCLKNLDNLYKSVAHLIDKKYFKSSDVKNSLIGSKLPHGYLPERPILPLEEEKQAISKIYYYATGYQGEEFVSYHDRGGGSCVKVTSFKYPMIRHKLYVKGPRTYMVTDDLIVTPLCMTSYLSKINALKIPLSDVTELVLHVGSEEALSILKASLASTSALSNGLSPLLKKQPKQEH